MFAVGNREYDLSVQSGGIGSVSGIAAHDQDIVFAFLQMTRQIQHLDAGPVFVGTNLLPINPDGVLVVAGNHHHCPARLLHKRQLFAERGLLSLR